RCVERLARDVPQRMFDGADGRAERLEAAAHADAAHDALDVARVLTDDPVLEVEHLRLHVGLGRFDLAPAGDALVGGDPDHGAAGDDRAFKVRDLHIWILPDRCRPPRASRRPTVNAGFGYAMRCIWPSGPKGGVAIRLAGAL